MLLEITLVCTLSGGSTVSDFEDWRVVSIHASDPNAKSFGCYAIQGGCEMAQKDAIGTTTVTLQRRAESHEQIKFPNFCQSGDAQVKKGRKK